MWPNAVANAALAVLLIGTYAPSEVRAAEVEILVEAETTKRDGRAWDGFGGAPDLRVCVATEFGRKCAAVCQDAFRCRAVASVPSDPYAIQVWDHDLRESDEVAVAQCYDTVKCNTPRGLRVLVVTPRDKTSAAPPIEPAARQAPPPQSKNFAFEGSPGEGAPSFELVAAVDVPLYLDYDRRSTRAGTCRLAAGKPLSFTSSFVVTSKPIRLPLNQPKTVSGTSWGRTRFLMNSVYYHKGTQKELSFDAASSVELLQYRAEGFCLYRGPRGEVFEAYCGEFGEPGPNEHLGSEWWIQADCGTESGWLRVEDLGNNVNVRRSF